MLRKNAKFLQKVFAFFAPKGPPNRWFPWAYILPSNYRTADKGPILRVEYKYIESARIEPIDFLKRRGWR